MFPSTWWQRSPGEVGPQARQLAVRFPVTTIRDLVASEVELFQQLRCGATRRHKRLFVERPPSARGVLDREGPPRHEQGARGAQSAEAEVRGAFYIADAPRLRL